MSPLAAMLMVAGLGGLVVAAHFLVDGAARLGRRMQIPPVVVGLTLVAFGTSAPELAVSLRAAFVGSADVAVGNIVGSNIFNILLILGLSALAVPLLVHRQLLRRDLPVMIGVSLLFWLLAADGRLGRWEGALLALMLAGYLLLLVRQRGSRASPGEDMLDAVVAPPRALWKDLLAVAGGIAGLVLSADWLVDGAVQLAVALGVSELVIGLTVVAVGTSLPELATSVVAAVKGERDIAIGNVVGSNIFNILSVVGLTALIAPAGLAIHPQALLLDIPVMVAIALLCVPLFAIGLQLSRLDGALLLMLLALYLGVLVLLARGTVFAPGDIAMICAAIAVAVFATQIRAWLMARRASGQSTHGG